jgi:hypothetical protein
MEQRAWSMEHGVMGERWKGWKVEGLETIFLNGYKM